MDSEEQDYLQGEEVNGKGKPSQKPQEQIAGVASQERREMRQMAWSVIRKATDEDRELLEKRALAFCKRHGVPVDIEAGDSAVQEVDWYIEPRDDDDEGQRLDRQYLKGLWLAVVRRALKHSRAEGIAWDTVGFSVE